MKNKVRALLAHFHLYGNPSKDMKIVGVTGTNGKTTVATMLYKLFTALGYRTGFIGTTGNIIVTKELETRNTTPGVLELNKIFQEMQDAKCEYVFMEVSSHGIHQGRIAGINFAGGIFTNLTQDHLDYHKTLERYFKVKKRFFRKLSKEAFALSNVDSQYGERMLEGIKAKKYTYGFKEKSDFNEHLETRLVGEFNEYNILAVYAASMLLGQDENRVKEIIKELEPPKGRFYNVPNTAGVTAIVDYAHTPDALENVLKTINKMKKDGVKVISVFGCGGDRDPIKRPIMGKLGAQLSDIAIFTSDNPRTEDPKIILKQMQNALSGDDVLKVKIIEDRRNAIQEAVSLAKEGDFILLAGKGHENYQEVKGVKHHFDDTEELMNALSAKQ